VLSFDDVSLELASPFDTALNGCTFALARGELLLVRLEREYVRVPIADAACGLIDPTAGVVRFQGVDWQRLGAGASCRARGRIGRVFEGPNWVSNLDVDENVLLAQRHHTHRSDADLSAEADRIARDMGMPGLPKGRPAGVGRLELARSAVVRALMGSPDLLLLERPEAGVWTELVPALVGALSRARDRGAAVVWLTNYYDVWTDKTIQPTRRAVVAGSQLRLVDPEPMPDGRGDKP
jgi:phospholipid/cholesterol/gamma-HCH transport system ATP-binding protein